MTRREYVLIRDQCILQAVQRLLFGLHVPEDGCVPHADYLRVKESVSAWERAIRDELGVVEEES